MGDRGGGVEIVVYAFLTLVFYLIYIRQCINARTCIRHMNSSTHANCACSVKCNKLWTCYLSTLFIFGMFFNCKFPYKVTDTVWCPSTFFHLHFVNPLIPKWVKYDGIYKVSRVFFFIYCQSSQTKMLPVVILGMFRNLFIMYIF